MLEKLKKRSVAKILPLAIILMIIGAVLLVIFGPDCIKVIKGPVPFESLTKDDLKNKDYVVIDYDYNFGSFAEETSTTTRNGVKVSEKSSGVMYAIPIGNIRDYYDSSENIQFMGIYFSSKYYNDLLKIDNNMADFNQKYEEWYYDYTMTNEELFSTLDEYLTVKGQILPMNSEMKSYYRELFEDYNFSADEINEACAFYYIKTDHMESGSITAVIIWSIVGLLLILSMIALLIYAFTGGFQKGMIKALNAKGASELEKVSAEYETGIPVNKDIRLGRNYIINSTSAKSSVVYLKDYVWAYMEETKNKQYFITVSTTYTVKFLGRGKEVCIIPIKNKEMALDLLNKVHERFPAMILGFSNDLEFLYKSDRNAFLNLYEDRMNSDRTDT